MLVFFPVVFGILGIIIVYLIPRNKRPTPVQPEALNNATNKEMPRKKLFN